MAITNQMLSWSGIRLLLELVAGFVAFCFVYDQLAAAMENSWLRASVALGSSIFAMTIIAFITATIGKCITRALKGR